MRKAWFLAKGVMLDRLEVCLLAAHAVEDGGDERQHADEGGGDRDVGAQASGEDGQHGEYHHEDGDEAVATETARLVGAVDAHNGAEEGEHGANEVENAVDVGNEDAEDAGLLLGKIAGEQLLKLRTFGLTEEEAEERIIQGFLK